MRALKSEDYTGKVFNNLTIVRLAETQGKRNRRCIAICACGSGEKEYPLWNVTSGHTISCGCLRNEKAKKSLNSTMATTAVERSNAYNISHKKSKNNTSGVTGVFLHNGKWEAQLNVNGKRLYLGRYESIDIATEARRIAVELYHLPLLEKLTDKELAETLKKRIEEKIGLGGRVNCG